MSNVKIWHRLGNGRMYVGGVRRKEDLLHILTGQIIALSVPMMSLKTGNQSAGLDKNYICVFLPP